MSSNASFPLQCSHSEICRIRVQILLVFASPECHWLQGGCRILAKSRNLPRIFSDSLMLLFIWYYHQALLACSMMHFTFKLHKGYLLCWCYIVCKKDAHVEMKKHQLPSGFPAFSIHFPKQPRDYFSSKKKKKKRAETKIQFLGIYVWHSGALLIKSVVKMVGIKTIILFKTLILCFCFLYSGFPIRDMSPSLKITKCFSASQKIGEKIIWWKLSDHQG